MNKNILDDPISDIKGFLVSLSPEVVDYNLKTEMQAIADIVTESPSEALKQALKEGREVLAMEPVPWKWVEDPELYRKFLERVLTKLEEEARRQGKL